MLLVYLVILEFLVDLVGLGYLDKLILGMKMGKCKILVFLVDQENLENLEIPVYLELQGMKVLGMVKNLVIPGLLVGLVFLGILECLVIPELLVHLDIMFLGTVLVFGRNRTRLVFLVILVNLVNLVTLVFLGHLGMKMVCYMKVILVNLEFLELLEFLEFLVNLTILVH
jgi:hypothetical protein